MKDNLYVYTNKYQKQLMQHMMDEMNKVTYQRLQLELALYGYVDINKFVKKYSIESFMRINNETCQM